MKTFDFYQDRKVTCWERTQFSIEAESYNILHKSNENI
nr:MAG TPA: hypothetical protein [Caudoviricetes sp.]